jgi:hypothetical protein
MSGKMYRTTSILTGVIAFVLSSGIALAQDDASTSSYYNRSRQISVRDRPHPEYDQVGLREGGFLVLPELNVTTLYDDNIYALSNHLIGDEELQLTGQVTANSQWSSNALNAFARIGQSVYASHSSEDETTGAVGVDGRLDYDRSFNGTGAVSYSSNIEPRTAVSASPDAASPVRYDVGDVTGTLSKEFNRLKLTGSVQFDNYMYDNGRTTSGGYLEEGYRDNNEVNATGSASYAISPDVAFFVASSISDFSYINNGVGVLNRNSNGYRADVGVDFELSGPFRGRLAGGYLEQSFDAAGVPKFSGYDVSGTLQWFPTQLTTVTANTARTVRDSGILTAPAYLSTLISLSIDHELYRNVLLGAKFNYEDDTFQGIKREDGISSATLSAEYLLNRGVAVSLYYDYINQNSTGTERGALFVINRIRLNTRLRY